MVGYGAAGTSCFETAAAASLSNTTAAVRKGNGCVDTDNNSSDFVIIGPIPRNSSSPVNVCGGNPALPSGVGTASPASVDPAGNILLTVTVTPATSPASTGLTVTGNLTSIGGSASQQFFDNGTNGDATAGDNVFSFRTTAGTAAITTGVKNIPVTITDAQSRTAPAPITVTVQSPTCGVERWAVKTGTDANVGLVNLNNPVRTTINALRSIFAPTLNPNPPYDPRFALTETTVYVVNGLLTSYKLEDDVDYHLVIQDPQGRTMITELPSPACDGSSSPFDALVAAVRTKFDARLTATNFFQVANLPVQVKGVGFFDFLHGQTGVAPNGIELHPVLDISFTAPSTTVLTSNLNPSSFGQPVTFTATVSIASGTPTGNVSFFDGGVQLGTGTLAANGMATLTTSALSVGLHSLTASYEGDSQAAESASTAFSQTVNPPPAWTLTKTHTGNFSQGQNGVTYTITASNSGAGSTNGTTITVTETIPSGLTLVSVTGPGWTCASNACTRADVLGSGGSYPALTVTANVGAAAAASVTNSASVSGGGGALQTVRDPTTINPIVDVTAQVSMVTSGLGRNRATGLWSETLTVTNTTASAINGPVQVVLSALSANATMVNNTGTRNGSPHITVSAGTIAPGASVNVTLTFANPTNGFINFTPIAFSGTF